MVKIILAVNGMRVGLSPLHLHASYINMRIVGHSEQSCKPFLSKKWNTQVQGRQKYKELHLLGVQFACDPCLFGVMRSVA